MIKKVTVITAIITIAMCRICLAPYHQIDLAESAVGNEQVYNASILAVGDNLIHNSVYNYAKQSDGSYNFDFLFENMRDEIAGANIAVINQETILVDDRSKISSYPAFGTPAEMVDSIHKAGFDIVLHATNHTYDKGMYGINATLKLWKWYPDITVLGIHESSEKSNEIAVLDRNNIKFAMLNYTYGLNGFTLPSANGYSVDLLTNKTKVINDVKRAKEISDVTVAFLHIGDENVFRPSATTQNYINDIIDAGADIVICAHPHVLEPYGMITTPSGNKGLVYYSLGNFHSGQSKNSQMLGGMAKVNVQKTVDSDGNSNITISDYSLTPLVTHFDNSYRSTIPLPAYSDTFGCRHKVPSMKTSELWNLYDSIMNK